MYRWVIIGIALLTIPAYAQEGCGDLNCNGICYEVSDLVLCFIAVGDRCSIDYFEQCTFDNGDVDGDGIALTIADAMLLLYIINGVDAPDFSRHPESDTIMIQTANAAPGETLELPLFIKTIDTLSAFQLAVQADSDLVTVDSVIFIDSLMKAFSTCDGYLYGFGLSEDVWEGGDYTYLPGEYHVADIVVTVNPDIVEPVTIYLEFLNDPENTRNTAFSNAPLVLPVTVDGEIQIIPTGTDDNESDQIPRDLAINAYPNPFNGNTNIAVRSDCRTELVIYDIVGRAVRRFAVDEGLNFLVWDATDNFGAELGSGVFFARLDNASSSYSKKIVYLK